MKHLPGCWGHIAEVVPCMAKFCKAFIGSCMVWTCCWACWGDWPGARLCGGMPWGGMPWFTASDAACLPFLAERQPEKKNPTKL